MMLSLIIVILSICIIVLVQARIVFMKWNNPEQPDHCTNDDSYDLTTISAAVLIVVLAFCFVIIGVLVRWFMLLRRLIGILRYDVLVLTSILILISSNERMCAYVKMKSIPKMICFSSKKLPKSQVKSSSQFQAQSQNCMLPPQTNENPLPPNWSSLVSILVDSSSNYSQSATLTNVSVF